MNICFPSVRMTNELENRSQFHYTSMVSFLLDCEFSCLREDNID